MLSKLLSLFLLVSFWALTAQADTLPSCVFNFNGEEINVLATEDVGESGFLYLGRTANKNKTVLFDIWHESEYFAIRVMDLLTSSDLAYFASKKFEAFEDFSFSLSSGEVVYAKCKK